MARRADRQLAHWPRHRRRAGPGTGRPLRRALPQGVRSILLPRVGGADPNARTLNDDHDRQGQLLDRAWSSLRRSRLLGDQDGRGEFLVRPCYFCLRNFGRHCWQLSRGRSCGPLSRQWRPGLRHLIERSVFVLSLVRLIAAAGGRAMPGCGTAGDHLCNRPASDRKSTLCAAGSDAGSAGPGGDGTAEPAAAGSDNAFRSAAADGQPALSGCGTTLRRPCGAGQCRAAAGSFSAQRDRRVLGPDEGHDPACIGDCRDGRAVPAHRPGPGR